jgi:hypothetical protein
VTRLAFLQLSESPFGEFLSVLLPSCAHLTYSANTQQVIPGCCERGFPKDSAFDLPIWISPFGEWQGADGETNERVLQLGHRINVRVRAGVCVLIYCILAYAYFRSKIGSDRRF